MFSQKLTLSDSTSPTPVSVEVELTSPVGVQNPANKSQRSASSKPLDEPFVLSIGHESSGKGTKKVDRHLVRLDVTKAVTPAGTTTPIQGTATVYMVAIVPSNGVISKADVVQASQFIANFMGSTDSGVPTMTRLLNGEL